MSLSYVFEYAIFIDITAWDRSYNHNGVVEFAIFFPVDVGSTLKMKAQVALNII
jgi:hypothetical protein